LSFNFGHLGSIAPSSTDEFRDLAAMAGTAIRRKDPSHFIDVIQLLCHQRVAKRAHSRPVPARPIEACDKAEFDGIAAGEKDDRNSRGCSLGRESRAAGDCQDHHHLLPPWLGQTDEDVRRGELFDEP